MPLWSEYLQIHLKLFLSFFCSTKSNSAAAAAKSLSRVRLCATP